MAPFTQRMWQDIADLYAAVLALPFNRELAAGTLERDRFLFYMIQDAHYLGEFSRALAILAAKAPASQGQITLAQAAAEAIVVERALHQEFFASFGVGPDLLAATPPSPTCTAYGNFLLATAYGQPVAVGLAAVLPCFEIYWKVGLELHACSATGNPYQKWIDTYADQEFATAVARVQGLTDASAEAASPGELDGMATAYRLASRYEWMFWESAYRREAWPV